MAIDVIHEVFPGAKVEWQRTDRVPNPHMTVDETTSGEEILTFRQRDMSDDFFGPGVADLKKKLQELKDNQQ
eukprot:CAMPEP_0195290018 /NCGR_PEP_ID=MMETSP0707-20130614/6054_1 /TAXON_ID=33640 /ORGANISM="Asterionellopsis glacialis, Strain CCMP134" /LENGTH=71 /DNA_ID=CAMNT_0040350085 /DNA_START=154 /DNA_END=369 /DNA_ORIENTATION=+